MNQEAISIEEEQFYRNNPSGGTSIFVNNKRLIGEAINELTKGEEVLIHYIVNDEEYDELINDCTPIGVLVGIMGNAQIKYIARDVLGKPLVINSQPPQ